MKNILIALMALMFATSACAANKKALVANSTGGFQNIQPSDTLIDGNSNLFGLIQGTPTAGHCAGWFDATHLDDAGACPTGTVTSVGLALPSIFSVTGSPVTGSGTLTGAFVTQTANQIFAGPASGSAAVPGFRAIVPADLGTGSASPSTYLRGDLTWGTPAGGGTVTVTGSTPTNGDCALFSGATSIEDGGSTQCVTYSAGTVTVYLTAGTTTFTCPTGVLSTVETIGGGGGGHDASAGNAGGGGAYSKSTNVSCSGTVTVQVGAGGTGGVYGGAAATSGGDTYFNGASLAASVVGAQGGGAGTTGPGPGGLASAGQGATKYSGGDGPGAYFGGGGGGGAGGPNGNGGSGGGSAAITYGQGGGGNGGGSAGASGAGPNNGGNNYLGSGGGVSGGAPPTNGGGGGGGAGSSAQDGAAGTDLDASHGSGGGGGGGADAPASGANGGLYGGGGGAGGGYIAIGYGSGGNGANGLVKITYLSGPPTMQSVTCDGGLNGGTQTISIDCNLGSPTAHGVLVGEGASPVVGTAPGTAGQVLTSNGASADPTFQALSGGGTVTVTGSTPTSGHCAQFSGATSIADAGAACGSGGGGGGSPGAMQLIQAQTLATSAGTITFSSIPATYSDLILVVNGQATTSGGYNNIAIQFNGDTGGNYDAQLLQADGGTVTPANLANGGTSAIIGYINDSGSPANSSGHLELNIEAYAGTTFFKSFHSSGYLQTGQTTAGNYVVLNSGSWRSTAAINSLLIYPSTGGSFAPGTTAALYGRGGTAGASTAAGTTLPQGRLTLTSGSPVMAADVTNGATLYYDCAPGKFVPYYNGGNDQLSIIGGCEVSDAMAASGTGVLNASDIFDVFYLGASGVICTPTNGSGAGWTGDTGGSLTARGSGYSAVHNSRGYYTNANSLTHCYNGATDEGPVAADQGTYLGSVYTTGAGTVTAQFKPSPAAGGSAPVMGLFNAYNRARTTIFEANTNGSSASGSFGLAGAGTMISFLEGLALEGVKAHANDSGQQNGCPGGPYEGIDLDSTSATPLAQGGVNSCNNGVWTFSVEESWPPVLGLHIVAQVTANPAGGNFSAVSTSAVKNALLLDLGY